MERARVERRANDASFESLPVEVVREILVRRAATTRGARRRRRSADGVSTLYGGRERRRCFLRTWI